MVKFPENQQFINCFYSYPNRALKEKDKIVIVSKNKNNEKCFTLVEEPKYYFYVTDSQTYDMKNKDFVNYVKMDDAEKVTCKYNKRFKYMANTSKSKETKMMYDQAIKNKDYKSLRNLDLQPEFHGSDVNIEDFYIARFLDQNDYQKNSYGVTIDAFDIEVDSSDYIGFPNEEEAPCPVNIISSFNAEKNTLYLFALKYDDNDTFNDFRNNNIKNSCKRIINKFHSVFGNFKVKTKFVSDELTLITLFFNQINTDKPDYVIAWNARFDILTLNNRLKQLLAGTGLMPEDIMCPEEFPIKNVYIKLDTSLEASNDFANRADLFQITGYSNWIDMMCLYANITKPLGKKESYSLDDIGREETGFTKDNLNEEGTNIKTAHLDNYTAFFEYNAVDSLLLLSIAIKTGFVDLLHTIVVMTRTRPSKALKKTVCLRNYADYFYNLQNCVISNNHSRLVPRLDGKIKGAFVGDTNNIAKVGSINGLPTNRIFDIAIDLDLSALYPSIDISFNISPDTERYKITYRIELTKEDINDDSIFIGDNHIYEDRTPEFFEHYISGDEMNFYQEYHNLPSIEEMYDLVGERL